VVEFAIDALVTGSDAGPAAALIAVDVATSAATSISEDCLETHGAMGHTWEFGGHRFLKQALVLRAIERGLRRECGDG
jgi:alkylation response protein AidB-like acyl-CoA dehydrogenase